MDKKKEFCLLVLGLIIILVGVIGMLFFDFLAGLWILLPGAIPYVIRLHSFEKKE